MNSNLSHLVHFLQCMPQGTRVFLDLKPGSERVEDDVQLAADRLEVELDESKVDQRLFDELSATVDAENRYGEG